MAYAIVVSLKQTLEPFVDSARSKSPVLNLLLRLIHEQLCYVKSFFEKTISLEDSNNVEEVEREIKDVVQNAQDLIESHLSDLFQGGAESSGFYPELVKVNAKLGSLVKELKAKEDDLTGDGKMVGVGDAAVSSIIDVGKNDVIVGLDEEIMMLKGRLFTVEHDFKNVLKVICIVGMGGIGKTTLAKQVFLDPLTIQHFDVRLFVEIGVEYKLEELLIGLIGRVDSMNRKLEAEELGEYLHKYLYDRRFLIVLDAMWDIEVWDQLRRFFPNNRNGSSIILTTRISNIARGVCSTHDNVLQKQFLDNEKSWELLRKMALSDTEMEECPPKLEKVGKNIAQNLGGLPLAIVMIGEFLSRSPPTLESWSAVAQNTHSPLRESEIPAYLSLSYSQLPQHLKACFLYLGLFPPNTNIPTALLIKLWVTEGFIEEDDGYNKSLEEKAREYLHDLVDRSLVMINELRSNGGIKTCRVHQLLLDLCVTEAQHQKLFHIVKEGIKSFTQSTKDQRRLGIYGNITRRFGKKFMQRKFGAIFQKIMKRTFVGGANPPLDSDLRSLVFICQQSEQPMAVNLGFKWLRVLHALSFRFREFPDGVVKLVRLKYLAITCDGKLPSSISRLRNLEFLIIHRSQRINSHMFLPLEIWKLQKLSHLECMGFDLPDPSTAIAVTALDNVVYLTKLVTLLGVSYRTCTKSVLARMPNLIKLGIRFDPTKGERFSFGAISSCLHRLESFKCVGTIMNRGLGSEVAFFCQHRLLPYGLRKLTLSGCEFEWDRHTTIISRLPNLQVLKLRRRAFCGFEWVVIEGEYVSLKLLVLEDLDLVYWHAASRHFPVLEQLHIRHCSNLIEIPKDIGDIPTLQVIAVDECSDSAMESATLIREEQESLGNETLKIRIQSSSYGKAKRTNSYYAHRTADISHSKEKYVVTATSDSTSETEVKPAPAHPRTDEKDNEAPLKTISLLQEDEVATSCDATSVAFAQSTAAHAPAQYLSNDLLPFKTISMLQEDEESGEFWVYATISSLKNFGEWSYLACRRCFTGLKQDGYTFVCHKCNSYDIGGRKRYYLILGVSDETGEATFRLWDTEFLKFIAETTYELNEVGELDELPLGMESLGDKKALFKVVVGEEQTKNFTGSYNVTEVIIDLDKFYETYSENQTISKG